MRTVKVTKVAEAVDLLQRDPDGYFQELRRDARVKAERETDRRIAKGPRERSKD